MAVTLETILGPLVAPPAPAAEVPPWDRWPARPVEDGERRLVYSDLEPHPRRAAG